MMTPLNCIISFADNLFSSITNLDQKKKAQLIATTAKLLKHNMRDLLDRSLLELGKLDPNFEPKNLKDLMNEVVDIMNF